VADNLHDAPGVIVFPPLLGLVTIVLSALLQWLLPIGILAHLCLLWRVPLGGALIAAGLGLIISGRNTLVRGGTNVRPSLPATALIAGGVYRWSRNPIYLGGICLLLGVAIFFAIGWLLLLIVPTLAILHFSHLAGRGISRTQIRGRLPSVQGCGAALFWTSLRLQNKPCRNHVAFQCYGGILAFGRKIFAGRIHECRS
jgi:hypothetical protein